MSRYLLAPFLLLSSCEGTDTTTNTNESRCPEIAARTNVADLINPKTGRLDRDVRTGEILDPNTGQVAVTNAEEDCIRLKAEQAITNYEG